MALADELKDYVAATHKETWSRRDGGKVPETSDIALQNEAVDLEAVVLYADLKDSTQLVQGYKDWFSAEVYKNYLYVASRIIRAQGGTITAFDGDRVMAIYIGGSKNSNAAKTALKINWAVLNILQPAINERYPNITYKLKQRVGIASSKTMVARTGIRGSNDLVWVGNAANIAAKLAALKDNYSTYITADVFNCLSRDTKYGGEPERLMWSNLGRSAGYGEIYGSTFWWRLT